MRPPLSGPENGRLKNLADVRMGRAQERQRGSAPARTRQVLTGKRMQPDCGAKPRSRNWRLSNTMDSAFCVEALDAALRCGTPEIFKHGPGRAVRLRRALLHGRPWPLPRQHSSSACGARRSRRPCTCARSRTGATPGRNARYGHRLRSIVTATMIGVGEAPPRRRLKSRVRMSYAL